MHFHRRELARILVATLSADFDDIAGHMLALLGEDAGDVCSRARSEGDEQ